MFNPAEKFEDDFRKNGYLANSMHIMQTQIERHCAGELALAYGFNCLAQDLYCESTELITGRNSHDPLCLGIQIMPRVLSSYQGALLMARQGMHIESLTLTRSVYESAFWIGFLHERPNAAPEYLFSETLRQECEMHRMSIDAIKHDEALLAETRLRMSELGQEYEARRRPQIGIDQVAKQSGFGDRYPEYRYLCGGAVHVNLRSILHYVAVEEDGSFNGHVVGPNEDEAPGAVVLACGAITLAIESYRRLTNLSVFDKQFQDLIDQSVPFLEPDGSIATPSQTDEVA